MTRTSFNYGRDHAIQNIQCPIRWTWDKDYRAGWEYARAARAR